MKGFILKRKGCSTFTTYWTVPNPAGGRPLQLSKGGFDYEEPARRYDSKLPKGRAEGDSAREYLNKVLGQVAEGTWKPDTPLTVRQLFLEHWLPARAQEGLRETTLEQYRQAIEGWVLPYLGGLKVAHLTPGACNDWQAQLRAKGLSPRSVQMATTFTKAATRWAVVVGLIARDPLVGLKRPRAQSREMTVWAPEQSRAFLAATKDDRLFPAWWLFLSRGLRRGEVAGLRWSALDLDHGRLSIATTRVLTNAGKAVGSTPKTKGSQRTIDLDAALVGILRAHWARQATEKLKAGEAYEDDGWVFCDELGHPYYPGYFSDAWERRIQALGLPRIRLHDARHSAATALLSNGVPVKVVSEMLGHANATITMSVYAHSLPGAGKAAGELLSGMLLGEAATS